MKLRGTEYGRIFCASGARGFFGEGYPFHRIWKYFGLIWQGTTFVAKTTTLHPRKGNLLLGKDGITPTEVLPRCMVVKPISGHTLNAVGLSGPGAEALFTHGRYQRLTRPFMLSFMSVAPSRDERLQELSKYVGLYSLHMQEVKVPHAQVLNFACPNVGLHFDDLAGEVEDALEIASALNIPLIPNFSVVTPVGLIAEVSDSENCDGIWIANTIPWGHPEVNWKKLFGGDGTSPLTKRGLSSGGGLSGPVCLPFALERLEQLRNAEVRKPIIIGNGIQSVRAVRAAFAIGADAVAIGIVGMLRPWRMRAIIEAANY